MNGYPSSGPRSGRRMFDAGAAPSRGALELLMSQATIHC